MSLITRDTERQGGGGDGSDRKNLRHAERINAQNHKYNIEETVAIRLLQRENALVTQQ